MLVVADFTSTVQNNSYSVGGQHGNGHDERTRYMMALKGTSQNTEESGAYFPIIISSSSISSISNHCIGVELSAGQCIDNIACAPELPRNDNHILFTGYRPLLQAVICGTMWLLFTVWRLVVSPPQSFSVT